MFYATIPRLCLIAILLFAGGAEAQISGGAFRGEVRDASNAVVPQSRVSIRSNDNGTEVAAESDSEGVYVSPNLIPGSYLLSAT
ncbi:MAG: carboxypeptidase-like regulatory domain-containing protein, partial [Bryobacteraceae bacterium]